MRKSNRPPTDSRGHVSKMAAMEAMGPVVYAARLDNGVIKIGWTEHFAHRLRFLKSYTGHEVELLAFQFGTAEDEQAIHAALVDHRAPFTEQAREYYHPTAEVMAVVNGMRQSLGMPFIAA